ncbi:DUF1178 family protein [uncultured Roseovarius sp.]|uniref:DUF1178 family protein n=1 Tax=uncultured Roseovarius sp. TaxID=293344 RepID=UPI0026241792|nr:DUF1178 family protein [uncultured Roseovarius sp.]
MIQFALRCDDDHRFESWFKSAEAFDKLHKAGMVSCIICGSNQVEKALMAPKVRDSRTRVPAQPPEVTEQALKALKKQVEQNSEYVGMNFVREARDIHDGTAPERSIYGQARPEEARKLIEDGVPVAPLPFLPSRKSN